jgi:hypothetical protein
MTKYLLETSFFQYFSSFELRPFEYLFFYIFPFSLSTANQFVHNIAKPSSHISHENRQISNEQLYRYHM